MDIHDIEITVRDVYYNNKWNFEVLYTNLPEEIKLQISAIPIVDEMETEDIIIWVCESSGTYSARSGYNWLQCRLQ